MFWSLITRDALSSLYYQLSKALRRDVVPRLRPYGRLRLIRHFIGIWLWINGCDWARRWIISIHSPGSRGSAFRAQSRRTT